jgi:AraC-like DNA-binding protein
MARAGGRFCGPGNHACRQALTGPVFGHLRISAIAFYWGFNSSSYFCRAFKEGFGALPGNAQRSALKR